MVVLKTANARDQILVSADSDGSALREAVQRYQELLADPGFQPGSSARVQRIRIGRSGNGPPRPVGSFLGVLKSNNGARKTIGAAKQMTIHVFRPNSR